MLLRKLEQIEILLQKGVRIAKLAHGRYKLYLYQVDSFYIEVWTNAETKIFKKLKAFASGNALNRYVRRINIESLFRPA
jgi:hypothetical protein